MERTFDLAVIGGGPGGYTAALYAARAGLSVVVLEKLSAGGQMALTEQVDNFPGFYQGIDGFALGEQMQQQAEKYGAVTRLAEVYSTDLKASPKILETSEGRYLATAVVYAAGAGPRLLGIPREQEFTNQGVHYCAACDGMRYRGKVVAVVGGGNSAVADALSLSRIAGKVYLIHRRDMLRADKIYERPLKEAKNIDFIWNSSVSALEGERKLQSISVENRQTGEITKLSVDALFVSVGRKPETGLLAAQLKLDDSGYIPADESTRTEIPGVFAVGDVRQKALRQIITAAADGAVAAHFAQEYLAQMA